MRVNVTLAFEGNDDLLQAINKYLIETIAQHFLIATMNESVKVIKIEEEKG